MGIPVKKPANNSKNGRFNNGVRVVPISLLPFKSGNSKSFESTWDNAKEKNHRKPIQHITPIERRKIALDLHDRLLKYFKENSFPTIIPTDGKTYGIKSGSTEEWAVFIMRMGYHESQYDFNLECDIKGNPNGNPKTSFGWLQLGIASNDYKVIEKNGKYPNFTIQELKTKDLQYKIMFKLIQARLAKNNNKIAQGQQLFNYFGSRTSLQVALEANSNETWETYENGNKSSPLLADGCYTNGFFKSGKKDMSDILIPTIAKDTDLALIQLAEQKDLTA